MQMALIEIKEILPVSVFFKLRTGITSFVVIFISM